MKKFIETYFETYPGIKKYKEDMDNSLTKVEFEEKFNIKYIVMDIY